MQKVTSARLRTSSAAAHMDDGNDGRSTKVEKEVFLRAVIECTRGKTEKIAIVEKYYEV